MNGWSSDEVFLGDERLGTRRVQVYSYARIIMRPKSCSEVKLSIW